MQTADHHQATLFTKINEATVSDLAVGTGYQLKSILLSFVKLSLQHIKITQAA